MEPIQYCIVKKILEQNVARYTGYCQFCNAETTSDPVRILPVCESSNLSDSFKVTESLLFAAIRWSWRSEVTS
jgi:hypothetical protein